MIENNSMDVDRYADLKAFLAEWYRPIEPRDGYLEAEIREAETRLGFRLPEALREFYRLFGKNTDLTYTQNCFCSPRYLEVIDSLFGQVIELRRENQAGWYYFIRRDNVDQSDPTVLFRWDEEGEWIETNGVLSDCLTQMVYSELYFASNTVYKAGGWIKEDDPFADPETRFVAISPTQWTEANVRTDGSCIAIILTEGGWAGQNAPEDADWVNLMAPTQEERDAFMVEHADTIVWDDWYLVNPNRNA